MPKTLLDKIRQLSRISLNGSHRVSRRLNAMSRAEKNFPPYSNQIFLDPEIRRLRLNYDDAFYQKQDIEREIGNIVPYDERLRFVDRCAEDTGDPFLCWDNLYNGKFMQLVDPEIEEKIRLDPIRFLDHPSKIIRAFAQELVQ